jgi:hypothetical protein
LGLEAHRMDVAPPLLGQLDEDVAFGGMRGHLKVRASPYCPTFDLGGSKRHFRA